MGALPQHASDRIPAEVARRTELAGALMSPRRGFDSRPATFSLLVMSMVSTAASGGWLRPDASPDAATAIVERTLQELEVGGILA